MFNLTCTQPKASVTPTLAQDEILKDNRRFCVLGVGRRWGKSWLSALKLKREALSRKGTYIHVSPSQQTAFAASRLFTEVLGVADLTEQYQFSIYIRNGSLIKFITEAQLKNRSKFVGYVFDGIVIEEPWLFHDQQYLAQWVFDQLSVSNSWLLLAGTPPAKQWVKRLKLLAWVVVSRAGFNPHDVACY